MANDYIKFGRTEYEVVGGIFDVQNAIPNVLLICMQVISHQSAMRTRRWASSKRRIFSDKD